MTKKYDGRDGLVLGMSDDVYHGGPEFSSSAAKAMLRSPADYKWEYIDGNRVKHKKAFDLGTAVHTKVLGTGAGVIAYPEELLSASGSIIAKSKVWAEEQRAAGLIPMKQAEVDVVNAVVESVLAHPDARVLFEQEGDPEASMFATCPETGVRLRARFDFLGHDRRAAVDLKTARKDGASAKAFAKAAYDLGYDVQRGHYLDVAKFMGDPVQEMVFVVVETEPPYKIMVHQLDRDFADMGAVRAYHARTELQRGLATGEWPGYPTGVNLLKPPVYAVYEFQDEIEAEMESMR